MVMKSAQDGRRYDAARVLDGAIDRSVLVERPMREGGVRDASNVVCTENSILIDYIRLTSAAMIALLSFFLTLFASPNGDRLFFIQMAKNREFSRPNREFKFRSCFGPAFGSVTNQDFCCG